MSYIDPQAKTPFVFLGFFLVNSIYFIYLKPILWKFCFVCNHCTSPLEELMVILKQYG